MGDLTGLGARSSWGGEGLAGDCELSWSVILRVWSLGQQHQHLPGNTLQDANYRAAPDPLNERVWGGANLLVMPQESDAHSG